MKVRIASPCSRISTQQNTCNKDRNCFFYILVTSQKNLTMICHTKNSLFLFASILTLLLAAGCGKATEESDETSEIDSLTAADSAEGPQPISEPLVTDIYTADPSAHVFEGRIYIYPSHDI